MRLFVAVKADDNIEKFVEDKRLKLNLNVRWLPKENLHITLIPPFEAEEKQVDEIITKLEKVSIIPTFLNFNKMSFGPTQKNPRLIWLSAKATDELSKLKQEIENSLQIQPEKRSFIPHITIARFKEIDYKKFEIKNLNEDVDLKMQVDSFSLIQSILSKEGAIYKTIKTFR